MLLYFALAYFIFVQANNNNTNFKFNNFNKFNNCNNKFKLNDRFTLHNDDWKIVGNKNVTDAEFRPFSLDGLMSNYIIGKDKLINVYHKNKNDINLWFFSKQFPDNFSLSNSNIFSFTMASLVGDFKKMNYENSSVSTLIKIVNNVTHESIIFPVKNLINKYNGSLQEFIIPMVNTLWLNGQNYTQTGVNHFKEVLQNVTQIDILGDWTQGSETMCLDNVLIN